MSDKLIYQGVAHTNDGRTLTFQSESSELVDVAANTLFKDEKVWKKVVLSWEKR